MGYGRSWRKFGLAVIVVGVCLVALSISLLKNLREDNIIVESVMLVIGIAMVSVGVAVCRWIRKKRLEVLPGKIDTSIKYSFFVRNENGFLLYK